VEESLKALQLAQRALFALVGALFVFVASTDRSPGPYEAALAEINTLQKVMPSVRQAIVDEDQSDYASSPFAKIVVDVAKNKNVKAENVKFNISIPDAQMSFSPPMYLANSPQTIDDYYKYIKVAPKFSLVQMYSFDETELRSELDKLLPVVGPELNDIFIGPMLDQKYKEIPDECQISVELPNSGPGDGRELKQSGPLKCHIDKWLPHKQATEILFPPLSAYWKERPLPRSPNAKGTLVPLE